MNIPSNRKCLYIYKIAHKIQYGYTGKTIESGNVKYLRITDIQNNYVNRNSVPFVDIDKEEAKNYQLNTGDIVFARTGATVGKSFLIDDVGTNKIFASYLIRIVPNYEYIQSEFLKYFFQSGIYWDQINIDVVGAAQPNFNGKKLGEIQITLPPLQTQHAIVARLDEISAQIQGAKQELASQIKQLDMLRQSSLSEVLESNEGNLEKLGGIIELNYGKGLDSEKRNEQGKYPIYGANGVIDYSDIYLVDGNSIIVGRKGSVGALTKVSGGFRPSDVTYYVTLKKEGNIDFIYLLLKSLKLNQYAQGVKPGLNRNIVYDLTVKYPNINTQQSIVTYLNTLNETITALKQEYQSQLQYYDQLWESILDQAFKGELVS